MVAAVSARPFVLAAAAAGYDVIALDAFADGDTRRAAQRVFRVKYADGHFAPAEFERVLRSIDLDGRDGMVYGSGFEAAPELLEMAAGYLPVLGNTPHVLRTLKQPKTFFALLDALDISYPEIRLEPPNNAAGWLYKSGGGSGGTHIQYAQPGMPLRPDGYFQREIKGEPVSLLFAADGEETRVVGFNRQWPAPVAGMPFRYGGTVSRARLPDPVERQLVQAAQQLTRAAGLRGLNSLDAIMEGHMVWVLEINPRLSATFDLYCMSADEGRQNLMDLHLRASLGDMTGFPELSSQSKAQQVVYSPFDFTVTDAIIWPEWVRDIPMPATLIAKSSPLCTVVAEGHDARAAQALVAARIDLLKNMLSEQI